jgi:hypothetical protein
VAYERVKPTSYIKSVSENATASSKVLKCCTHCLERSLVADMIRMTLSLGSGNVSALISVLGMW